MKKVTLLEVGPSDLNRQDPMVGGELLIRGIRYRILQVKPRKAPRSKWSSKNPGQQRGGWQVLVETLEETA